MEACGSGQMKVAGREAVGSVVNEAKQSQKGSNGAVKVS